MQSVENTAETYVNTPMSLWLEERIRLRAASERISKAELMRRAIVAYLGLDTLNEKTEAGHAISN